MDLNLIKNAIKKIITKDLKESLFWETQTAVGTKLSDWENDFKYFKLMRCFNRRFKDWFSTQVKYEK